MFKRYKLKHTINGKQVKATASTQDKYVSFCVDGKRFRYKFLQPSAKIKIEKFMEGEPDFINVIEFMKEMSKSLQVLYKKYHEKIT